jgi:RNase P subunit RPR2
MSIKDVNSKKFDVLHKKKIDLKSCPICSHLDAEVKLSMKFYGKEASTVYVECKQCGRKTGYHPAVTCFNDTEQHRFGSWITDKSLMHAIYSAIEEWNGERRSENEG